MYFKELSETLKSIDKIKLQNLKDNIKNCSGTIYIIGNGGSSSIA